MYAVTGRERQWAIELTGTDNVVYGFPVMNVKGTPAWTEQRVGEVQGDGSPIYFKESSYRSFHSGYGWSQYLAPNTYHYCTNLDARFPGQVILGPLVSTVTLSSTDTSVGVTGIFENGTKIYTISGKYVNEITPSTDAVTAAGSFPYDLTTGNAGAVGTMGVNFDGNVIIGVTTASAASMVGFTGSAFDVLADNSAVKGAYLARYWEDTDWRLAATHLASSAPSIAWIAQGSDPEAASVWSAAYGVGDTSSTLTGLVAVERTLYIAASDGLYYLDGQDGRAPLLIPAMPRDSTNGVNLIASSEGQVWYPSKSGLYLYNSNSGTIDNVAPGRGLADRSGIRGTYTALAQFRAWVFCAVYDGTDSYIMAGRQREEGEAGFGPYIWHGALAKITGTKVTSMLVSSLVTPPRLWMGLLSGNVAYIKLPNNGDNPLDDTTNYRYALSGSLYLPADDYGIGGMRWNLQDVIVEAEGLDASTYITVYERRDQNSGTKQVETATVVGTITGSAGTKQVETMTITVTTIASGYCGVVVTAAGMTNSPVNVIFTGYAGDTATVIATRIRDAINTGGGDNPGPYPDITDFFTVTASGADVIFTAILPAANDATMNMKISGDTTGGISSPASSANTTAGAAPTGGGNATVIVTAANMSGSPVTVTVNVSAGDTASDVAGKIRTDLAAHATIGSFFAVSGTGANVVGTTKIAAADDSTMNIDINNGTCTGLTDAPTSTNTTAGVSSWTQIKAITSSGRTVISPTGDKRFSRCELRFDVVNAVSNSTPVIRVITGRASRRATQRNMIQTTVLCSDEALSRMGTRTRVSGADLAAAIDNLDSYYPTTLKDWWTGSVRNRTVLVIPGQKRVVQQEGDKAAALAVDLTMLAIATI